MKYNFDIPVDHSSLPTMKWEKCYRDGETDLLCFGLADTDFCAPPQLVEKMIQRASIPHYGYVYTPDSYYQAVVDWFDRHVEWEIEKDWILRCNGIYPAICLIIQEFTNLGDGVIFQSPVHEVFWTVIEANGRKAIVNPLILERDRYGIDFEDFEKKIIKFNVRMMILCSPHNPVGRIWTQNELIRVAEICLKHRVIIVSDEVYSPLVYEGNKFTSIASISPESSLNTITCFSPSKAFGLTGLKDSLVITSNEEYLQRFQKALVRMNMNFGANLFGTVATECVLRECDDWLKEQIVYVRDNRHLMDSYFKQYVPNLKLMPAESTLFAWVDCRSLGMDDAEIEEFFYKKVRILIRPGFYMGEGGSGFVRFVLSCPRKTLKEALDRIHEEVKKLQQNC